MSLQVGYSTLIWEEFSFLLVGWGRHLVAFLTLRCVSTCISVKLQ